MQEAAALLALQDADVEILRAVKRLEDLPEKRAILTIRAKAREVGSMHEKAQLLVRKLEAEIKARQDEIALLNEKLEAEQNKVMGTADHRQVQALTREMDGLRRRVDKLEMECMQYMERVDKAKVQVTTIDSAIQSLGAQEAELIEHFKAAGGELQTEIAKLQRRRKKLASAVNPETLTRYEEIRKAKGGVGVGRLEGESCTACRMGLPAERVRDLNAGPDVGICPQCRRLIVVRSQEDE